MVGVPGRSKGCNTCIQRKIRCDQRTPFCGNCSRSKRACGGYNRKTIFVFSENVTLQDGVIDDLGKDDRATAYHGKVGVPRRAALACQAGTDGKPTAGPKNPVVWSNSATTVFRPLPEDEASQQISLLSSARLNDLSVLWQPLHDFFTTAYMPKGGLGRGNLSETDVTGDWIIQLHGGVIDSPALQASVAAYAAAHLARENRDSALLQRSREMYTRGLEHLRYALARQSTRLNNETLATCLALSMYELSEAPDAAPDDMSKQYPATEATKPGSAYSSHLLGAMALVELRGPDVNRSPLAHSLFLCVRRYALLGTLINRRDTFLSKKPWKDRPWAVYRKNKLDTCLDALFDMPAVMRQWADVAGEENEVLVETKCNTIVARCKQLHVTLRDWFRDLESSFSGPLYRDQFCKLESSFDSDDCGKVFPISFHYSCFSVAYLLITYWSGVMIVHNLAMEAHYKLAFLSSNSSSRTASCCNAAERHSQLSMMMIRNMCQSIEYFMGQDTGRLGLTMATGVLQGCLATMRGGPESWEREQGWAMEMMQRIGVQLNLPKREMFAALN